MTSFNREKAEKYSIGCKINLFMHIVGRLENGYHELESVFLPIDTVSDTIYINESKTEGLSFFCNQENFNLEENTLTKAYKLFCEATNFYPSLEIYLEKNIPSGAGLGGGSADAGFLLRYLFAKWKNILFDEKFVPENADFAFLNGIAVQIGADVPFFLINKPCYVSGIGEKLEKIEVNFIKNKFLLLISPKIHVDTVGAFKAYRAENKKILKKVKKNAQEILTSVEKKAIKPNDATIFTLFRNDLEQCVFSSFPALGKYKEKLFAFEAEIALMSGSGSSLFGIFQTREKAEKAKSYFDALDDVEAFAVVEF